MRETTTPEQELTKIKYQLAQLAYDIFQLRLNKSIELPFDQLSHDYKNAWSEGVWAAVEAGKNKNLVKTDAISKKEQDNGYLVYNSCKEIKKLHPNFFTYSKFPEHIKEKYREVAKTIYEKMDNEETGE